MKVLFFETPLKVYNRENLYEVRDAKDFTVLSCNRTSKEWTYKTQMPELLGVITKLLNEYYAAGNPLKTEPSVMPAVKLIEEPIKRGRGRPRKYEQNKSV